MSSAHDPGQERRKGEIANWQKLDERLDGIDGRLLKIEKHFQERANRRRIIREFFDDFGHWITYIGKVVVSLGIIGGAAVALIAWIASNGP